MEDFITMYNASSPLQRRKLKESLAAMFVNIKRVQFSATVLKGPNKGQASGTLLVNIEVDIEWQIECHILMADKSAIVEQITYKTSDVWSLNSSENQQNTSSSPTS